MPTNQIRRPSSGGKRHQLLSDLGSGVRTSDLEHRATYALPARAVGQELLDERRDPIELAFGDDDRAAASLQTPRVLRLVIHGRMRIRDEDRRQPGCRELPDRAARTGEGQVGRAIGRADLVRERKQTIVGPRDTVAKRSVVPLTAKVQDGWPRRSPAFDRELV